MKQRACAGRRNEVELDRLIWLTGLVCVTGGTPFVVLDGCPCGEIGRFMFDDIDWWIARFCSVLDGPVRCDLSGGLLVSCFRAHGLSEDNAYVC